MTITSIWDKKKVAPKENPLSQLLNSFAQDPFINNIPRRVMKPDYHDDEPEIEDYFID